MKVCNAYQFCRIKYCFTPENDFISFDTGRFYPGSNVSCFIFTAMPQQQLFLFDREPEQKTEPASSMVGDEALPLIDEGEGNMEAFAAPEVEESIAITEEDRTEAVMNPFLALQQQQQEKIELMLLTPNKKRGRKSFKAMDEESILIDVPEDEVLYQKQYYPTRMVAEWFGITATQLRAWENEFDILQPKKNGKGDRFFRPEDVKNLKLIYHLIRRRKFTVQGAKQYLEENRKGLQTKMQLTEALQKFRQFLLELKAISG